MFGMSKGGGKKAGATEAVKKPAKAAALVAVTLKMTAAQRDRLQALGGAAWLRAQIDAAREEGGS